MNVSKIRDLLVDGERAARDQQFNIGHVAALLATLAREAGEVCVAGKIDGRAMQGRWLRVEYLSRQLDAHLSELDRGLAVAENVIDRTRVSQ